MVLLIAYFPVSLFEVPLSYDMNIDFFPWRFMAAEALNNGEWPFWNPFQVSGYPIHADPQSGVWYPIFWILAIIGGQYSYYDIHIEFLFHLYLAGVGMYKLIYYVKESPAYSLIAGITFMLCGFFVSNSQHLPYVIAAAWLPFCFLYYLKMCNTMTFSNSIKASLSFSMLFTGGYPMLALYTVYTLIMIVTLPMIIQNVKLFFSKANIMAHLWLFVFFLILTSGLIASLYYALPIFTRAQTMPWSDCSFNPFTPVSFISFLLPFATVSTWEFTGTDISMANAYMGLFFLISFFCLFGIKSFKENFAIWFVLILSITLSVGEFLPVRRFFYDYIPTFNISRFPAMFRLFFIFYFIYLVSINFNEFEKKLKSQFKIIASIFVILLIAVFIYLFLKKNMVIDQIVLSSFSLLQKLNTQNTLIHILMQMPWQILLLSLLFLVFKQKQLNIKLLTLLITIDMVSSVWLNLPYTVISPGTSIKQTQEFVSHVPKGFPSPGFKKVIAMNDSSGQFQNLWRNVSAFKKEPAWDGFSSSFFKGNAVLYDYYPEFFRTINTNPLCYLTSDVRHENHFSKDIKSKNYSSNTIYTEEPENRYEQKETGKVNSINLTANSVWAAGISNGEWLVCMQNNYIGWKCFLNGKEIPIVNANKIYRAVYVPKGHFKLQFIFENQILQFTVYLSVISLVISSIILIFNKLKVKK